MGKYNFTYCFVWVWSLVPHAKGTTYIEGVSEQSVERE
jgi:hypothetical protein